MDVSNADREVANPSVGSWRSKSSPGGRGWRDLGLPLLATGSPSEGVCWLPFRVDIEVAAWMDLNAEGVVFSIAREPPGFGIYGILAPRG